MKIDFGIGARRPEAEIIIVLSIYVIKGEWIGGVWCWVNVDAVFLEGLLMRRLYPLLPNDVVGSGAVEDLIRFAYLRLILDVSSLVMQEEARLRTVATAGAISGFAEDMSGRFCLCLAEEMEAVAAC